MNNPLEYLEPSELMRRIMQNIEIEISYCSKNNRMRHSWECQTNWGRVQTYLTRYSKVAGRISAYQLCEYMGVDPDSRTFFIPHKGENK